MSGFPGGGIGPVEPGEGTEGHEVPRTQSRTPGPGPLARAVHGLRTLGGRHRRPLIVLAAACVVAAGTVRFYATRPEHPAPLPPAAPSQTLSLSYGEPLPPTPDQAGFTFTVRVRNTGGPPVTVERIGQPSRALSVTIQPRLPVTVGPGEAVEVILTIQAKDCVHVARNSSLPFLEVTLSNGFQKEDHSYIPGDRYARDLSVALTRACPEDRDVDPSPRS
ncbi:Tat pathway signal sequence domain protein [Streptomyces sp. NPDC088097]|uniref:Tat pathway signal sequence domain protein n=1 Tax=Streptomyces sp. NPDC088097 TaxID=3365823 RepID=UPI0037F8DCDA